MTAKEILSAALKTYGAEPQTVMVMEEMAELTKELCKHARGADNTDAIAEEMADVYIMLSQMEILHGVEERVIWWYNAKLARLEERLKAETKQQTVDRACADCALSVILAAFALRPEKKKEEEWADDTGDD